ncbi:MAG: AtpZ/AtpI family protein [Alphaproteobacteria bacterium]|nr:AtpZ/AtpI family protein [Alphaproteobacteria bacterium]
MTESKKPLPSLESLQQRIDEVKGVSGVEKQAPAGNVGKAMNMAVEFVAAAAVAGAGGYFLDDWLGTSPLFFILGFLLGFATGVYNLMRASKKEQETNEN